MDNNILACEHGIQQLKELSESSYKVDLNQGMDARLVDESIADIIARMKWIKYIRFSCDSDLQIKAIENVVNLLRERNVSPTRISVYILVTKDLSKIDYRVQELCKLRVSIYAQAERNLGIEPPSKEQKEFCNRYVYGRCYKKETWLEYCQRNKLTNWKVHL